MHEDELPILLTPMKTASTTLWRAILKHYNPSHKDYKAYTPKTQHLTYKEKLERGLVSEKDHFVLTIRNPYVRPISFYCKLKRHTTNRDFTIDYFLDEYIFKHEMIKNRMVDFIEDCPSYNIIRFESYNEDVKKYFDIDIDEFEHETWGHNSPYTTEQAIEMLEPKHIEKINKHFYQDFVDFEYDMVCL